MKKYFLLIFLLFSSCDNGPWDDAVTKFHLNEHYIVIDWSENGICNPDSELQIFWNGQELNFYSVQSCYEITDNIVCPHIEIANFFEKCIEDNTEFEGGECPYINRPFILTDSCKLLIDVDALNANPLSQRNELFEQTHGQPNEDFYVNLQISNLSTETQQTVDATFLPVIFDDYENCRSTGYEENDYNELYQCFDSLPAHHSLSF